MKNTVKIYDDFFKVAIHYVTMLIFASNTSKIKHVHIKMKTNGFCCFNNESIVKVSLL